MDSLKQRAEVAESALLQSRMEYERPSPIKESPHDAEDKDRRSWLDDIGIVPGTLNSRPSSPAIGRSFNPDVLLAHGMPGKHRKVSTPSSLADGISDTHPLSARPSIPASLRHIMSTGSSTAATTSTGSQLEPPQELTPVASSVMGDKGDIFEGVETPSSPKQPLQDAMSVSTVAAGPSVQLVERMSAAIRRLEGEKVVTREELLRVSNQRDEARAEIVALMKEVEDGKRALGKVIELEKEVSDINSRYQTTLEMLGEKSELVEELRADVDDVKAMYRELIERTVR